MASLRFNYDGEKRPERGRPVNDGNMARRTGFPYLWTIPMPPRPLPGKRPNEVEAVPPPQVTSLDGTEPAATLLPVEDDAPTPQEVVPQIPEITVPLPAADLSTPPPDSTEQSGDIPIEPTLSDSERFIVSLENYENGVVKIRQHVDSGKFILDDILSHMDSFLKILDVLKENQERKKSQAQVSVALQKTSKDTIDEVLELLQTPAFQNILRQVLMGILAKK